MMLIRTIIKSEIARLGIACLENNLRLFTNEDQETFTDVRNVFRTFPYKQHGEREVELAVVGKNDGINLVKKSVICKIEAIYARMRSLMRMRCLP